MKIMYSPNVIGCRISNEIYLNPKLIKGSKLHTAILKHEKGHTSRFTMHDLKHDLNNQELVGVKKDYWKFIMKHPRSLISFLPLCRVGKYWCFDISLSLIWLLAFVVFGVVVNI